MDDLIIGETLDEHKPRIRSNSPPVSLDPINLLASATYCFYFTYFVPRHRTSNYPTNMKLAVAVGIAAALSSIALAAPADDIEPDVLKEHFCWCSGKNFVGHLREHHYTSKFNNLTFSWTDTCQNPRKGRGEWEENVGCPDLLERPQDCMGLPDGRRYPCVNSVHQDSCHTFGPHRWCVGEDFISINETRHELKGHHQSHAATSYVWGDECDELCLREFGSDPNTAENLVPLCRFTWPFKRSPEWFAKWVPFNFYVNWVGAKKVKRDKRNCNTYSYDIKGPWATRPFSYKDH